MPTLGADMTGGVLVEWLKQPGDAVDRGDLIAVVETDKGAIEIEVFQSGVIDQLCGELGARYEVGDVLAFIRGDSEPKKPTVPSAPPAPAPAAARRAPAAVSSRPDRPHIGRVRISPAARRHAEEAGIDITTVEGTGRDGAITLEDVERQVADTPVPRKKRTEAEALRGAIAAAMARSNRDIPHYYVSNTIDATPLLNWISAYNADRPPGERLLPVIPIMKAAVAALKYVPALNGHWMEDSFRPSQDIHLGTAIALRGGGLVAPAIENAQDKSASELMAALRDLTTRTRAGRIRRVELTGGTFTVTSLGEGGIESMTPLISPPQVSILALGSFVKRPWSVNGEIETRPVITMTLGGDHRASDGRDGGRFLEFVARQLSKPEEL